MKNQVDCTEAGKDTCGKHGVSGYPTLKIFRNGKISQDYDGPRQAGIQLKNVCFFEVLHVYLASKLMFFDSFNVLII